MRLVLILQLLLLFLGCAQKSTLPNIIIIFTDDQGYGDLGCYGAEGFETPNIDKMAEEGILFTDHLKPLKKRMLKKKLDDITKGKVKTDYLMKFPAAKKKR